MEEYNIYCDESCHLPHDNSDIMVIGGLSCPKEKAKMVNKAIRNIKESNGVYKFAEIKWTKVSESRYEMFRQLIDLFFDSTYLNFRAVIANKSKLDLQKYNLTHDDWYQRIYFLTLREMVDIGKNYHVYVDIKDTKGSNKIEQLREVLNNVTSYYFYDETVENIQLLRSDQIQLMQLADLLIGAVSYANRGLYSNQAKLRLIEYIEMKITRSLKTPSPKIETKFNVFKWMPREG